MRLPGAGAVSPLNSRLTATKAVLQPSSRAVGSWQNRRHWRETLGLQLAGPFKHQWAPVHSVARRYDRPRCRRTCLPLRSQRPEPHSSPWLMRTNSPLPHCTALSMGAAAQPAVNQCRCMASEMTRCSEKIGWCITMSNIQVVRPTACSNVAKCTFANLQEPINFMLQVMTLKFRGRNLFHVDRFVRC